MNKKLKFYMSLIVIFVLGGALGALGASYYIKNQMVPFFKGGPLKRQSMMLERLDSQLNLSPDQKRQVKQILEDSFKEIKKFRQEHRKKMIEQRFEKIRPLLNDDQKETLGQMEHRIKNRVGRMGKHRPGEKGRDRGHLREKF